jgi:hypothetical protein
MSEPSKFKDEEIERLRRQATAKRSNVDYDRQQLARDLLVAARTDTPEEFQARMTKYGVDPKSDRGHKVMEAYWAIRREQQR